MGRVLGILTIGVKDNAELLLTLHVEKIRAMNICPKATIIAAVIAAAALTACNSDDDVSGVTEIEDTTLTNVEVKSFKLGPNSDIASNLDSLHFAIDLAKACIFNADSLPVGTVPASAVVTLELPTVSKAEFVFTDKEGESKTVDYLTNPADSIDFRRGDVRLRVVSANGNNMLEYTVKLNVHLTKPDSLTFGATPYAPLPAGEFTPTASRTVMLDGELLCLATDGRSVTAATTANPAYNDWAVASATLPSGADLTTLTASGSTLYTVASGHLYRSADRAATWADTGAEMTYIYGAYADGIIGCTRSDDGSYKFASFPEGITSGAVPAGCPVEGTSQALTYTSEWAPMPLTMVMGGRRADGSASGSVWAFDGQSWADISVNPAPAATGLALVPYQQLTVSSQWKQTFNDVLLAFGGTDGQGQPNNAVYMSRDRGVHWTLAPACMQPSSVLAPLTGASAFVINSTLNASGLIPQSRVSAPITTWECPYIYLIGGTTPDGRPFDGIRRGQLNALTFIPIY